MLFSEPKIPQCVPTSQPAARPSRFSALQRAENSSIDLDYRSAFLAPEFQCSSASRKFLNFAGAASLGAALIDVSVLFSEPKIPQSPARAAGRRWTWSHVSVLFSEPKIPQFEVDLPGTPGAGASFSALQRAENSSMENVSPYSVCERQFQCSSASRKFLNIRLAPTHASAIVEFQCSSASRKFLNFHGSAARPRRTRVSVLFSEPKIPQSICDGQAANVIFRFSALQRAENSSIQQQDDRRRAPRRFQCSSASRKFLNFATRA